MDGKRMRIKERMPTVRRRPYLNLPHVSANLTEILILACINYFIRWLNQIYKLILTFPFVGEFLTDASGG